MQSWGGIYSPSPEYPAARCMCAACAAGCFIVTLKSLVLGKERKYLHINEDDFIIEERRKQNSIGG